MNWIQALRRVLDYAKDPNPNHWRTINGAKVHLDASGKYDGGAQGKFNGRYHYGPEWKQKSALMNRLAGALHAGVSKGKQNTGGQAGANSGTVKAEIKETNFPPEYNQPKEKKNIAVILDYINNKMKDKDSTAYKAYMSIGRLAARVKSRIKVTHHGDDGYIRTSIWSDSKDFELRFPIPKKTMSENKRRSVVGTWLHENMHALDYMCGPGGKFLSETNAALNMAILTESRNPAPTGEVYEYIVGHTKNAVDKLNRLEIEREKKARSYADAVKRRDLTWPEYYAKYDALKADYEKDREKVIDEYLEGDGAFCGKLADIYNALSGGKFYNFGLDGVKLPGHGVMYYMDDAKKNREMVANWGALRMGAPNLAKFLYKDRPKLAKALDEVLAEIADCASK